MNEPTPCDYCHGTRQCADCEGFCQHCADRDRSEAPCEPYWNRDNVTVCINEAHEDAGPWVTGVGCPATASVVHADGPAAPQPSEDTRDGEIEALRAEVARRAQAVTRLQMHHDPAQCPDGGCQIISLMDRAEAAEARADRLAATLADLRALVDGWERTRGGLFGAVHVMEVRAILDREAPE